MRLDEQSIKGLEDISNEFECRFEFGNILREVDIVLYGFYKKEISSAAKKAFELGYDRGVASIKRVVGSGRNL